MNKKTNNNGQVDGAVKTPPETPNPDAVVVTPPLELPNPDGAPQPQSQNPGGADTPPPPDPPPPDGEKKIAVSLRHKTEYTHYRRAGLVLSQKAQIYEVTEAQLAVLEKDAWVEVCA